MFNSYFLFKKKLITKKIELTAVSDVSILKFNMARKAAIWVTPNPEQTEDYAEYRVYGLNSNHSKRTLIYTAQSKEQSKLIVDEIVNELDLNLVGYNPPRSSKRRR